MEVRGQIYVLTHFPPGKNSPAPLNRKLCGLKKLTPTFGEHKNRLFHTEVGTRVFYVKGKYYISSV
jgi:hypothetical protein